MTVDNRLPEQRGIQELGTLSPETKVYPLGFTPDIKQWLKDSGLDLSNNPLGFLTEEEIAVVLAKISRNPGGFLEISKTVDEEGASAFHGKWVVSVEGYGHASVAEHAMIHMAVENVSSLAGDEITDNRLASFTEFSARFKGVQERGYYIPAIVSQNREFLVPYNRVHANIFALNSLLMKRGIQYIQNEEAKRNHPERKADGPKGIKTTADQFKNLMPASRFTSIGVTINARETEHMDSKFLSSPYLEVQEMGKAWKEQSLKVAPTLVKYADRNNYLVLTKEGIKFLVENYVRRSGIFVYPDIWEDRQLVNLIDYDPKAEDKFIAASLYSESSWTTFSELLEMVERRSVSEKEEILEKLLGNLGKYDAPIRMLEFAGDYKIEIPGMTYGDWREWKRHRIETYDAKNLSVDYGYMIPELAKEMDESEYPQYHGCVEAIEKTMAEVEDLYHLIQRADPLSAHYCVTRFHYRPAIVKMNMREAFHFISLRTGPTAHPFIRRLAWAFYDEIKNVHPLFAKHIAKRIKGEGRPSRDNKWTY